MDEDEGLASTGRRSYPSDGAGESIKQCWRMDIGQTPMFGQRHVPDKALDDGAEGSEERAGGYN